MITIILLLLGLGILAFAGDYLIKAACAIALRLKVPPLVIGLTVVAFGTSAPELFVSTTASYQGNSSVAIGNVLGSNIFNYFIILAATALMSTVHFSRQILIRELPIMIVVQGVFYFLSYNNLIGRVEGALLVAGIFVYTVLLIRKGRKANSEAEIPEEVKSDHNWGIGLSILILLASLGGLMIGGNLVVENAVLLAKSLGVSDFLIGVTIVAAGTSLPELATSIAAARKGQPDIAVGNVVGSNVFNILFIIGASALVRPLEVASGPVAYDFPFMFWSMLIFWPLALWRKRITKPEAFVYLAVYIAYVYFSF